MGLHISGDFAGAPALGALEEHVLVEVCQPGLVRPLVGAPGLDPDLEGRDLGGVLFLEDDGESVGKRVADGHKERSKLSPAPRVGKTR